MAPDSSADAPLFGSPVSLSFDGQSLTGKIVRVNEESVEAVFTIDEPASGFRGMQGRVELSDGQEVSLDLGRSARYNSIRVEIPRVKQEAPAPRVPGQEQRHYFRLGIEIDVDVVDVLPTGYETIRESGRTVNISGGGMLLSTPVPILPGSYTFRVHIPGESLLLNGRVIRSPKGNPTMVPIQFENIHEVERSKLIRFIFRKMRNLPIDGEESEEETPMQKKPAADVHSRSMQRRERFFPPSRPRYW